MPNFRSIGVATSKIFYLFTYLFIQVLRRIFRIKIGSFNSLIANEKGNILIFI